MFWEKKGGGRSRQPVGLPVGTATSNERKSRGLGKFCLTVLDVPAYTHERRPCSATLYPTSFALDSLLALAISAQCKTYGWCSTPGPMAGGDFLA